MTLAISSTIISHVKKKQENFKKTADALTRKAEKEQKTNPELAQISLGFSAIHDNLAELFKMFEISMESINSIAKTLDELPDREEFESLRQTVKEQGKETMNKFTSIEGMIEKGKKRQSHGN